MNNELCPKVEHTLNLISKKWIPLIVYTLRDGPKKFSQIEHFIPGLSSRLLTERLKDLEKLSILKKTVTIEENVKIKYELTKKGYELSDSFKKIEEWAEKWH